MSRSYRHNLIHGITTARSEKEDKRILNRIWRSRVNVLLRQARLLHEEELDNMVLPESHNDIMNVWSMAKDGKCRYEDGFQGTERFPLWKAWGK